MVSRRAVVLTQSPNHLRVRANRLTTKPADLCKGTRQRNYGDNENYGVSGITVAVELRRQCADGGSRDDGRGPTSRVVIATIESWISRARATARSPVRSTARSGRQDPFRGAGRAGRVNDRLRPHGVIGRSRDVGGKLPACASNQSPVIRSAAELRIGGMAAATAASTRACLLLRPTDCRPPPACEQRREPA